MSDASTSKQLPTLILFKEGKEIERRPYADSKGKLVKFLFSLVSDLFDLKIKIQKNISNSIIETEPGVLSLFQDNVKAAFDLNNVYKNCKSNPIKRKEKKPLKIE